LGEAARILKDLNNSASALPDSRRRKGLDDSETVVAPGCGGSVL
jgi:hypothetical protein